MGTERTHRPIRQSSGPDRQWPGTPQKQRLRYVGGTVQPPRELPQARGEFANRNLLSNPEMAAQVFGTEDCEPCSQSPADVPCPKTNLYADQDGWARFDKLEEPENRLIHPWM